MPLTIPSLIEIKTAAGATAAFLSPEADGLKECFIDNELNGQCVLTFSIPTTSDKKQYLTEAYRIYAPDSTGTMKEFVILTPDSIDRTRDGEAVWDKVTAQESWVKLGKDYVDPGISNDPQTPSPPALAVIVLSGGSDLSGGLYTVGSAAHALYAILQGTGWTVGTADQTGTFDLETEKISVLMNIQKIQETWGGYLVWDSVNKTVSLRDETTWAPYTGYQIRYAKNLKGITRTSDFDIITKLYPFGEDDLNIGSVNGGQIYLTNNTYTAEVLEGIYTNQDLATAQTLKDDATKYLAKVCKPRHNYRIDQVDLRTLSGYAHESFDVGHMVDIIDADLDANDQARVIRHRFNVFQPWICELEVGDPLDTDADLMADNMKTVRYLNAIKNSKGQITAYKLVDGSLISQKIAAAAVDASKLNTKTVILFQDTWTDNSPAPGSVAWNQHKLYYAGVEHVILTGNTAQKYIYWDGVTNTYSASASMPTLTDGQFIVAVNNGGLHDTVWDKGYAREFIGSVLIADAAILSTHIGLAQILDAHIANLSANKINVTDLTALSSGDGYSKMLGDGFRVYDESGNLKSHNGSFEALGPLVAAFTRASTAYLSDGTLVASGVPRYEYGAFYPADPNDRALMIEVGTSNIILWSQDFDNAAWVKSGSPVVTANYDIAPDGTTTADKIEDNSTTSSGQVYQTKTIANNSTSWTAEIFIKKDAVTTRFPAFFLQLTGGTTQVVAEVRLNTSTGATAIYLGSPTVKVDSLTNYWRLSITVVNNSTGNTTAYVNFFPARASTIDGAEVVATIGSCVVWGAQLENKAYPTSYMATTAAAATRAAEVLTIPMAGILSPTEGTWEQKVYVTDVAKRNIAGEYPTIFVIPTASGSIGIWLLHNGTVWDLQTRNDAGVATEATVSDTVTPNGWHRFTVTWSATEAVLFIDGVRRATILNPNMPSSFGTNMYVGSRNGSVDFLNTLFDDLRFSNKVRTDQEIADAETSGLPLKVDDATTYKMGFDSTLQPTVRYFGLYTQNGRFILVDPLTGQGFEVWDGAVRKIIFGRLDDGTIGGELNGCKLYASDVITGAKGSGTYIGLTSTGTLIAKVNGNTILQSNAATADGNLYFGRADTGATFGQITRTSGLFAIDSVSCGLRLLSPSTIDAYVGTMFTINGDNHTTGTLTAGNKLCTEKTSQGVVGLFTRESPEQRYIDEGRAELVNGQCIIDLLELVPLPECIEQESDLTKWHVHLTPIGKFTPCVIEIYDSYIAIASIEPGINGKFTWSLSATRKGKTGVRFPRMEWLVGGDEESDPVLTSNWEDNILSGV